MEKLDMTDHRTTLIFLAQGQMVYYIYQQCIAGNHFDFRAPANQDF